MTNCRACAKPLANAAAPFCHHCGQRQAVPAPTPAAAVPPAAPAAASGGAAPTDAGASATTAVAELTLDGDASNAVDTPSATAFERERFARRLFPELPSAMRVAWVAAKKALAEDVGTTQSSDGTGAGVDAAATEEVACSASCVTDEDVAKPFGHAKAYYFTSCKNLEHQRRAYEGRAAVARKKVAQKLLGEACAAGDLDAVKRAVASGADAEAFVYDDLDCKYINPEHVNGTLYTAVHVAADAAARAANGLRVLRFVVAAAGADPNVSYHRANSDSGQCTPCYLACRSHNHDAVRILIALGALPDHSRHNGRGDDYPYGKDRKCTCPADITAFTCTKSACFRRNREFRFSRDLGW